MHPFFRSTQCGLYLQTFLRILQRRFVVLLLFFVSGFLVYLYLKRAIYPDVAFDSINYHFFVGKSGYENFPLPFSGLEFFPMGFHSFNPIIDMMSHAAYRIMGYRLGTIFSLLSILGIYLLIPSIVQNITDKRLTFLAKLFLIPAVVVNEAFFQIGTYFTDNVYAFFILLYVSMILSLYNTKKTLSFLTRLFFLGVVSGIILTKLTNIIYSIPLFFVTAHSFFLFKNRADRDGGNNAVVLSISAAAIFAAPIVLIAGYYFLYVFLQTGNPVFPFYNSLFKSPYFPLETWQFNFGAKTFYEKIFYPYFALQNPLLLGEVKDLFPDVKLIVGILLLGLVLGLLKWLRGLLTIPQAAFMFTTIASYCLWQWLFGYSRYAIALEFMIGLSIMMVINKIALLPHVSRLKYLILFAVVSLVLLMQQARAIWLFNTIHDIGWRPSVSYVDWKNELRSTLLIKYTLVTPAVAQELKSADVIVQCVNPSSAYGATIRQLTGKPMLNFDKGSNGALTSNKRYIQARDKRVAHLASAGLRFAAVLNNTNEGGKSREGCLSTIAAENEQGRVLLVEKEFTVDNFVGDKRQILTVFLGRYFPDGR